MKDFIKGIYQRFVSIPQDKLLHFMVSVIIVTLLKMVLGEDYVVIPLVTTMGIGLLKELYDKFVKKTEFDFGDFAMDFIGAIIGIV